jgi:ABC-2 type transport system ATP-binding protein
MQRRIRRFIGEYNDRYEATVLLTSHYMADVVALCERVVVIHHGKLLFDGALDELVGRFAAHKTIIVDFPDNVRGGPELSRYGEVLEERAGQVTLRVPKAEAARITGQLLADLDVYDLTIQDPPIEEVIELVFAQPEL